MPSPPGAGAGRRRRVTRYLATSGSRSTRTTPARAIGSTMGNLYTRLEPTAQNGGTPIFLCAHLDTVPPDGPIEPVVDDEGIIRNARRTILGADDKSAVAVMLEAVRRILAEGRPHAGIELVFTPKEETGLEGAGAFDETRLVARVGYVFDQASPIGDVILGAPHQASIEAIFRGKAAHAGMAPEEGRSAIAAAARAIADLRLGRLDESTTASVGLIRGGTAKNVVPERCSFDCDVRSHDHDELTDLLREMLETIDVRARRSRDCDVETHVEEHFTRLPLPAVGRRRSRIAVEALQAVGPRAELHADRRRRGRERLQRPRPRSA